MERHKPAAAWRIPPLSPWTAAVLNAAFVIMVFGLHPGAIGPQDRGLRGALRGPRIERVASLMLLAGWGLQLTAVLPRHGHRRAQCGGWPPAILVAASGWLATSAQRALTTEWRTSVAGTESGSLVTRGPYRQVRHPAYTAFSGVLLANVFAAPRPATVIGGALALSGLNVQARFVEEPALRAAHGHRYEHYSARVGRFVPRRR